LEQFRITPKAVIFLDGKVLLLRKITGKWDLPGGRLNDGEEIESCLVREATEELGLGVTVGPLIQCNLRRLKDTRSSIAVITHLCKLNGNFSDIELSPEHAQARLFSRDEIDSLEMRAVYRKPVHKAFSQQMNTLDAQQAFHEMQSPRTDRSLFQKLLAHLFSSKG